MRVHTNHVVFDIVDSHRGCDQFVPLTDALGPCSRFKPGFMIRCCKHPWGRSALSLTWEQQQRHASAPNRAVTTPEGSVAPYYTTPSSSCSCCTRRICYALLLLYSLK